MLIYNFEIEFPLVDYTLPFHNTKIKASNSFLSKCEIQLDEVLAYFLYYNYTNESLSEIEQDLFKEPRFFNMNDVTCVNGKFRYRTITTKAKNELIKLKLFDSKGQITELGIQVKSSLQEKHINTEKAIKLDDGLSYRVGISIACLKKEIVAFCF